jgi:acylphosphatase
VHDVGYRYILMGMAMANRIRMFEAHNIENSGVEEVQVFADGDEEAVKAFCAQVETKRPVHSDVSNFVFEDFEGDVMKIGEYAQLCATIQLNKAIPVLLDMREDLKAVRKTGDETLNEIKAVRKNTDTIPQIHEEIKGMREDIQPGYGMHFRQMQTDIRAIKERLGMQ